MKRFYAVFEHQIHYVEAEDRSHIMPGMYWVPSLGSTLWTGTDKQLFETRSEAVQARRAEIERKITALKKLLDEDI